jgi:hypothetical protein
MHKPTQKTEEKDIHICPDDDSTTVIAKKTECCGGQHQTIAGALLKSKYWKDWYAHASKNMLRDVDETETIDAMSDGHFEEFVQFAKKKALEECVEVVRKEKENAVQYAPPEKCNRDVCESCAEMKGRENGVKRACDDIIKALMNK